MRPFPANANDQRHVISLDTGDGRLCLSWTLDVWVLSVSLIPTTRTESTLACCRDSGCAQYCVSNCARRAIAFRQWSTSTTAPRSQSKTYPTSQADVEPKSIWRWCTLTHFGESKHAHAAENWVRSLIRNAAYGLRCGQSYDSSFVGKLDTGMT